MRAPSLRVVSLLLVAVAVLAAVVTVLYSDVELIRDFGPNVATESLALVLTLAVVRKILERQERGRRLRASLGPLRTARRQLHAITTGWADLVKACLPAQPAERPVSLEELFASHYTEHLGWADTLAEESSEPRLTTFARRFKRSRKELSRLVRDYGAVLDPDYIEVLAALVDDPFLKDFIRLSQDGVPPDRWRFHLNVHRGLREAHFRTLITAVDIHNRLAREAAEFRSHTLLPRAAALDIALSPVDDLLLETHLREDFWGSPPRAGALRRTTPPPAAGGRSASTRSKPFLR